VPSLFLKGAALWSIVQTFGLCLSLSHQLHGTHKRNYDHQLVHFPAMLLYTTAVVSLSHSEWQLVTHTGNTFYVLHTVHMKEAQSVDVSYTLCTCSKRSLSMWVTHCAHEGSAFFWCELHTVHMEEAHSLDVSYTLCTCSKRSLSMWVTHCAPAASAVCRCYTLCTCSKRSLSMWVAHCAPAASAVCRCELHTVLMKEAHSIDVSCKLCTCRKRFVSVLHTLHLQHAHSIDEICNYRPEAVRLQWPFHSRMNRVTRVQAR
jgi:hypothetical protein